MHALALSAWLACAAASAAPRYVEVRSAAGFAVELPTAPWVVSMSDSDGGLEAVAPRVSSAAAAGTLLVQELQAGRGEAARFLATFCSGGPAMPRRGKAGVFRVAEGASPYRARLVPEPFSAAPEIFRVSCASLEAGARLFAITWTAPAKAYERGLPAFDKAVATLTPEKR